MFFAAHYHSQHSVTDSPCFSCETAFADDFEILWYFSAPCGLMLAALFLTISWSLTWQSLAVCRDLGSLDTRFGRFDPQTLSGELWPQCLWISFIKTSWVQLSRERPLRTWFLAIYHRFNEKSGVLHTWHTVFLSIFQEVGRPTVYLQSLVWSKSCHYFDHDSWFGVNFADANDITSFDDLDGFLLWVIMRSHTRAEFHHLLGNDACCF